MERLDRVLLGEGWAESFQSTRVTHLPRISSDHSPLLVRCKLENRDSRPPFRFQSMWTRHRTFLPLIRETWEAETGYRGMFNLQLKLDRVKGALKRWNREVFGNLFEKLRVAEKLATDALRNFELDPSPENRSTVGKFNAEYLLCLKMEEDFWKQKAAVKWVAEGERNTKYFQGWVRQKRVKGRIHKIAVGRDTLEEDSQIKASAVDFFQNLLAPDPLNLEEPCPNLVCTIPPSPELDGLTGEPSFEEVKEVVWSIPPDSTPGPDGFSSLFFQFCWDIVGRDVVEAVSNFFEGGYMPRSFTSTMIVLLPKKECPISWSDFRPISLCNVTNKIISKVLAVRVTPILPKILAPNQSGFIKGRIMSDNVLLAQELIHEVYRSSPSPNMALKLDMAKAYDRVQWPFLLKMMTQMGFPPKWCDLVERCISSCWVSIMINGGAAGFFKTTRGLRQGDPLSPALFVIAADYLSRSLDRLILNDKEMRYKTSKYVPGVSHLAYADDLMIFTQAKEGSVRRLVQCLEHYEAVSRQKINADKSSFFLHDSFASWARSVRAVGGYQQGAFPIIYLGAPLTRGVIRTDLFSFLRQRITNRIHTWSHKFLSFGGRLTLIKSILGAIPIHVFQVIEPTNEAIKQMEQVFARYFWGSSNTRRKTHWIKWSQCCLPTTEGGLGIRNFRDTVRAFSLKTWWRFRAGESLWAQYMYRKYCTGKSPMALSSSSRHSPVWRRMCRVRDLMQHSIKWAVGKGLIDFWDDIWVGDVPLRSMCGRDRQPGSRLVRDFWTAGEWDEERLKGYLEANELPENTLGAIMSVPFDPGAKDLARWEHTSDGNFSSASAWNLVRQRQERFRLFEVIWSKGITPTISVFLWRLIANRIPVDSKLQWRHISLASKCRCCEVPQVESVHHLFIQSEGARAAWSHFASWFPNSPLYLRPSDGVVSRFRIWGAASNQVRTTHLRCIIPGLIFWFIWTERNDCIYRGTKFQSRNVIWRVKNQLHWLRLSKSIGDEDWVGCKPQMANWAHTRKQGRITKSSLVKWHPPDTGWLKLNVDGAYHARSGKAGGGGIFRDHHGKMVRAFSCQFTASSGWEAEIFAVHRGVVMAGEIKRPVWVELDAEAVVKLINLRETGPANMRHTVNSLHIMLRQGTFKVSHICREGNKAADLLARRGAQSSTWETFSEEDAPASLKALVELDRIGLPNFRFRTARE